MNHLEIQCHTRKGNVVTSKECRRRSEQRGSVAMVPANCHLQVCKPIHTIMITEFAPETINLSA